MLNTSLRAPGASEGLRLGGEQSGLWLPGGRGAREEGTSEEAGAVARVGKDEAREKYGTGWQA